VWASALRIQEPLACSESLPAWKEVFLFVKLEWSFRIRKPFVGVCHNSTEGGRDTVDPHSEGSTACLALIGQRLACDSLF
jgi:hypothetical protein